MNLSERAPTTLDALEQALSCPTPGTVDALARVDGDILILGAGGKMGPSLAVMAKRASEEAGVYRRIIAVSRFGDAAVRNYLERHGVETISCDLLVPDALAQLPDAPNIVFMAGMKFGATQQLGLTWAMNTGLPTLVCNRYLSSRMVVFSTGNIYGLTSVAGGGSKETDIPNPEGEYAMSALGRERIFEHYALAHNISQSVFRLNYACDLRYGVLVDIARRVMEGRPVSLEMGYLNTIWQGDANAVALASLAHASVPPLVLNVTGQRILKVRDAAETFGRLFGKRPILKDKEAPDALLSDSSQAVALFGPPLVDEGRLMHWVADWLKNDGALLDKPTHFESRDGRF